MADLAQEGGDRSAVGDDRGQDGGDRVAGGDDGDRTVLK